MNRQKIIGLAVGLASITGCASTSKIVKEFSSIYADKNYRKIQEKIYSGEISCDLLQKIAGFYNCTTDEACLFAAAQSDAYDSYGGIENAGRPRNFVEFYGTLRAKTLGEIEFEDKLEKLEEVIISLDASPKTREAFQSVREKLIEKKLP